LVVGSFKCVGEKFRDLLSSYPIPEEKASEIVGMLETFTE